MPQVNTTIPENQAKCIKKSVNARTKINNEDMTSCGAVTVQAVQNQRHANGSDQTIDANLAFESNNRSAGRRSCLFASDGDEAREKNINVDRTVSLVNGTEVNGILNHVVGMYSF